MKTTLLALFLTGKLFATTISIVPIYEPISLHGTDVDDIISDTGEALQATVLSRPMALSGAFPEVLVEAIRTSNPLPTNTPAYKVTESNLLVLCGVTVDARLTDEGLLVSFDVTELDIPMEVDLTSRQLLKLSLVALQRTLEAYHVGQTEPLNVFVTIDGTNDRNATLRDLDVDFQLEGKR
ncbi:hypothetical protein [Luteolibacter sp. AS25]|uniref:hypothetical protein n=1 Tax=Luteolibacter sp. AS25 TaxID=3135776 RepID=UPI00398B72E3